MRIRNFRIKNWEGGMRGNIRGIKKLNMKTELLLRQNPDFVSFSVS